MATNTKPLLPHQLYFLTVQSISSILLFAIPYIVNDYSKHNAWISAIITLILFQLMGIVTFSLHKRLPDKHLFQMTKVLTSKWVGGILNWLYIIYYIILATYTTIYFCYLSKEWTLPVTPLYVIYMMFIILGVYLALGKITSLARFSGIILIGLTGFLLFCMCFAISKMNPLLLLPVGNVPLTDILKGSYHMSVGYVGGSSLLVLLPMVEGSEKSKKRVVRYSILTVSLIYLFLIVICLAHFGSYTLELVPIPVLYLLKILTVLGIFERMDLIIMCAWIAPMLISYALFIYVVGLGIVESTYLKSKKLIVWILSILIFILCAIFPATQENINLATDILLPVTVLFMVGIPILLLAVAKIRKINRSTKSSG